MKQIILICLLSFIILINVINIIVQTIDFVQTNKYYKKQLDKYNKILNSTKKEN